MRRRTQWRVRRSSFRAIPGGVSLFVRTSTEGSAGDGCEGPDESDRCAGAQLDVPVRPFQRVAEAWVLFEESMAIGWG
jgi:hypothetical protein